jgi:hypothetical protein
MFILIAIEGHEADDHAPGHVVGAGNLDQPQRDQSQPMAA